MIFHKSLIYFIKLSDQIFKKNKKNCFYIFKRCIHIQVLFILFKKPTKYDSLTLQ